MIDIERLYENAIDIELSSPWAGDYEFAAKRFDHLGSYKDSAAHAENCRRLAGSDQSDPLKLKLYLSAVELLLTRNYRTALPKFKKLAQDDFRNSRHYLAVCRQELREPQAEAGPVHRSEPKKNRRELVFAFLAGAASSAAVAAGLYWFLLC